MINFRAHHFLCAYNFRGLGYSKKFVNNYKKIVSKLVNPNTKIKVIGTTDDICAPCPWNKSKVCAKQNKVSKLDQAHEKALNIKIGDIVIWGDIKKRIEKNITLNVFEEICKGCQWQDICKNIMVNDSL